MVKDYAITIPTIFKEELLLIPVSLKYKQLKYFMDTSSLYSLLLELFLVEPAV